MAHMPDGGHGYADPRGAGGFGGGPGQDNVRPANSHYQHQQPPLQMRHDPRQATRNNTLPHEIRPLNNARYYGGHSREPSLRRIASVDHNLYVRRNQQNNLHHGYAGQLSPGFGAFPRGPPPPQHPAQHLPMHPSQHIPKHPVQRMPQHPPPQRHAEPSRSQEVLSEESMTDEDYYDESEYEGTENIPGDYGRVQSGYSQGGLQGGYTGMEARTGTPAAIIPPYRPYTPASGPSSRSGSAMGMRPSPNSSRPDLPLALMPGARQRTSNGSMSSVGTGLKMPLAFNSIQRERDLAQNGELYASPTSSPTSSYAPSPSTPGFPPEDLKNLRSPQSRSQSTSQDPLPSNEDMRRHLFPNATLNSLPPNLELSPGSHIRIPSMNFSRVDGRTSFRSAVTTAGNTDRSSMVSQSSGMFTVDEAIGMYGSETDTDDDMKLNATLSIEEQKILLEQEFQEDAMKSMRGSISQQSERSRASSGPSMLDGYDAPSKRRPPPPASSRDSSAESSPISPTDSDLKHIRQKSSQHTFLTAHESAHVRQKSSQHTFMTAPDSKEGDTTLEDFPIPPTPVDRVDDSPRGPRDSVLSDDDQVPPPPVAKLPPKPVAKEPPKPCAKDRPTPIQPPARDRYGFKKQTTNVSLAEYEAWSVEYEESQIRRRVKWEILMKEAGLQIGENGPTRFPPKSQKLKRYVRKGIPPEWRGAAWFWFAGGPAILAKNHGLYAKILEGRDLSTAPDYEIIERDLHRTFPDNIHFKPDPEYGVDGKPNRQSKVVETPVLQSLRRVLVAFSLHVPKVGYCQSLNFLAGLLLLFMDEEKAFWMLFIITQHLLPGTHDLNLGSDIDQGVLMLCIRDNLPLVWSKIGHNVDGVLTPEISDRLPPVALVTLAWFMNAFLCNLPIETALRVWDCWFYEGPKTLFRISLAILKMGENELKGVNEQGEAIQAVQNLPRRMVDAGALMELCFKRRNGFGHLSQEEVDRKREERRRVHLLVSREGAKSARPGSRQKSKTLQAYSRDDSSPGVNYGGGGASSSRRFLRGITGKA